MLSLVRLKESLRFAKELQAMIEVLKAATAAQFRGLQHRRKEFEGYRNRLNDFLSEIEAPHHTHPFLKERAHLPKLILLVTSDEGFLGGLNASVINAGLEQGGGDDELVVIGERGARYLSETQTGAFTVLPGISDEITYQRAVAVRELLIARFTEGKIGTVLCAYPQFMSLTAQRPDVTRLLPCRDIFGQKWSDRRKGARRRPIPVEPALTDGVDFLARAWLLQRIYDIFWESKLSECAARLIHLEGSHEEIGLYHRRLQYDFFRNLHEKSDKNIREIFASRLQWKSYIGHEREVA